MPSSPPWEDEEEEDAEDRARACWSEELQRAAAAKEAEQGGEAASGGEEAEARGQETVGALGPPAPGAASDTDASVVPPPPDPPSEARESKRGRLPCAQCGKTLGESWARNCKWCAARGHLTYLVPCSTDECGWLYCSFCEKIHTHTKNKAKGPVGWMTAGEWKQEYERARKAREEVGAGLDDKTRRLLKAGEVSEEQLRTLVQAAPANTPFTRFTEGLAAASLSDKTRLARELAAGSSEEATARGQEAASASGPPAPDAAKERQAFLA